MKLSKFYKLLFIYLLISVIVMSGCSKKNQKPTQSQENKKPPESLTQIESNIENVISLLDKEGKIEEKEDKQKSQTRESQNSSNQNTKSKSQDNKSEDQSGGQQGGQSGSQQGGQSQKSGTQQVAQQAQTPSPWVEVDRLIKEIHRRWNEYQPEAAKNNVSRDVIDNFGTDLNTVTNDIAVKNLMSTLININNLYKYVPEFLSSYKDKSADIKRLEYFVRDAMYKSRFDKWSDADASISGAKSLLPTIRNQAKEENKDKYQSLEYAVHDLEKVIKERQKSLAQIKGNVVLESTKTIKNIIKQDESKSGGASGSGGGGGGSSSGGSGSSGTSK